MKKVLFSIIIVLLLAAFGVSAFMVGNYLLEGKEQKELYNELSDIVNKAETGTLPTQSATQGTEETTPPSEFVSAPILNEDGILLRYAEIYEMNPDTIGWIKIEGTELDYPVMQTPDEPNFYLYKNFNKDGATRGSIYAREECDLFEPSDNVTIYGHNMADGSMFAALNAYVDKEAWDYNNLIFFDTIKEYHIYQIFAVFKTSASLNEGFRYHQFVDAANEEEFNEFVATCKDLAFYETGITPQYGDKLICLSTCEYTLDNGRLVVAAVRIT